MPDEGGSDVSFPGEFCCVITTNKIQFTLNSPYKSDQRYSHTSFCLLGAQFTMCVKCECETECCRQGTAES